MYTHMIACEDKIYDAVSRERYNHQERKYIVLKVFFDVTFSLLPVLFIFLSNFFLYLLPEKTRELTLSRFIVRFALTIQR